MRGIIQVVQARKLVVESLWRIVLYSSWDPILCPEKYLLLFWVFRTPLRKSQMFTKPNAWSVTSTSNHVKSHESSGSADFGWSRGPRRGQAPENDRTTSNGWMITAEADNGHDGMFYSGWMQGGGARGSVRQGCAAAGILHNTTERVAIS